MAPAKECLHHSAPYKGNAKVIFGNGKQLPITHTGTCKLCNNIHLNNVLVVPNLTKKLLSISKLTVEHQVDVLFSQHYFDIQDRNTKQVLARGTCTDGLYVLKNGPQAFVADVSNKASYELWHAHLGHISFDVISTLNKCGVLSVTTLLPKSDICTSCQLAKDHRLPLKLNDKRASFPLDLIHCDLWGPSPITSPDGFRYYVIFIDDFSRFTWFYPLKTKTGFYAVLSAFIKLVQNQCSRKIKTFQSDGGTEFVNQAVRTIFEENGTFHRYSCPYTPQQNGRAERKHHHIVETGLAMLFNAHVPAQYWVDAFTSATYIVNRVPSPLLNNKSPFELLFGQVPNYSNFRVYGCQVFPYLRDYAKHKLEPRSLPCIFIGYSSYHKGFRCLDPSTNRIFISRHARFNESFYPFKDTNANLDSQNLVLTTFCEELPFSQNKNTSPKSPTLNSSPSTNTGPNASCPLCDPSPNLPPDPPTDPPTNPPTNPINNPTDPPNLGQTTAHSQPSSPTSQPDTSTSNFHPMITRAKAGVFKPKYKADLAALQSHALHVALSSVIEPRGFKSASKDPKWMAAMVDEIEALNQNNTWTLVPRPSSMNVVGSKWVLRVKYHADGSIERYKARVVAQGFTQITGLDYSHMFSPVVKASTVRIVLSLAVLNN